MGSIEAYIHVGIIIEASIHKGKDAQKHVHKGINSSKGILWNFICLDLKWVRPEKRFIKIYWLIVWYLFGYDLQFYFLVFNMLRALLISSVRYPSSSNILVSLLFSCSNNMPVSFPAWTLTIHVPSFRWEGAIYPCLQNIVNQDHSKLDLTVTSQFFCQDIQVSDTLS